MCDSGEASEGIIIVIIVIVIIVNIVITVIIINIVIINIIVIIVNIVIIIIIINIVIIIIIIVINNGLGDRAGVDGGGAGAFPTAGTLPTGWAAGISKIGGQ